MKSEHVVFWDVEGLGTTFFSVFTSWYLCIEVLCCRCNAHFAKINHAKEYSTDSSDIPILTMIPSSAL